MHEQYDEVMTRIKKMHKCTNARTDARTTHCTKCAQRHLHKIIITI